MEQNLRSNLKKDFLLSLVLYKILQTGQGSPAYPNISSKGQAQTSYLTSSLRYWHLMR